MEKIKIGFHMSTSWTDPPIRIMCLLPCGVAAASISLASLNSLWYESSWLATVGAVFPWLVSYCAWNFIYHPWWDEAAVDTRPFVLWRQPDSPMAIRYRHKRIPMACLYEYYIAGDLDFNPECEGGDCYLILNRHRDKFINYKITWSQVRWLLQQFLPAFVTGSGLGYGCSSGKTARETEKEIKEHYDKGNSVFSCMLGRSMVYTCALFETAPFFASDVYDGDYARSAADGSLEAAQHNKMRTICDKLHLKHGEQLLDIGCGWGTLMRHATAFKGAESTGITLSVEGKRYCDHASLSTSIPTKTILSDYRLIPELDHQFEKVASIEMAEHVGIANFANPYLEKVKAFMKGPDSRFCLQVSGLKQQPSFEDLAWGLFMSRYVSEATFALLTNSDRIRTVAGIFSQELMRVRRCIGTSSSVSSLGLRSFLPKT